MWQMSDEGAIMQKKKSLLAVHVSAGVIWDTLEKWADVQVRVVSQDHDDRPNWQLSAVWQMCHDMRHAAILTTLWPGSTAAW